LAGLDGSCRTPIAGLAEIKGQELTFNGLVLSPDGTESLAVSRRGPVTEARALGADAAEEIRRRAPQGLLDAIVSSGQKS
jgi:hydroxymethylbilane synthase